MRRVTEITPELARAIDDAARTEASVPEEEQPDFVEIGGERYWRHKPQAFYDPGKPPGIAEGYTRIVINIAPHAPNIRIDNRLYYPNMEYDIRDDQVATFNEIMARTWDHERQTGGAHTHMAGAKNTTFNLRTQASRNSIGAPGVPGGVPGN